MNTADFTRQAGDLVARNDRHPWLRGLRTVLRRASRRALIMWCALAVAGVAVYMVPPYTRFYS